MYILNPTSAAARSMLHVILEGSNIGHGFESRSSHGSMSATSFLCCPM